MYEKKELPEKFTLKYKKKLVFTDLFLKGTKDLVINIYLINKIFILIYCKGN